MVIKNIVIAGGGPTGLITCGAISEMIRQKIIDTNNIEKIYATSIGGFIGVLLCLDYNWQDDIYNFFVKRPWEKTISIESDDIMDMFNGGCYLDKLFNIIKKDIFLKIFEVYEITEETTLLDLYNITNKELYMYTININTAKILELSYKTTPNLSLIKALSMTSCLPPIFRPVEYEEEYYMDGGAIINYPLNNCIKNNKKDETFGFNMIFIKNDFFNPNNSNMFSYINHLFNMSFSMISTSQTQEKIENEIILNRAGDASDINIWTNFFTKKEFRHDVWMNGVNQIKEYLKNKPQLVNQIQTNQADND